MLGKKKLFLSFSRSLKSIKHKNVFVPSLSFMSGKTVSDFLLTYVQQLRKSNTQQFTPLLQELIKFEFLNLVSNLKSCFHDHKTLVLYTKLFLD